MGRDEAGTLAALKTHRTELLDAAIAEHHGRIVKLTGDGMLVEFSSVVNAVACAVKIQNGMQVRNADVPSDLRIEFRIGVHLGDIIVEDDDIFGDGVNVAARIESVAKPGGIAVSAAVRDNVGNRLDLAFEDTGEQALKNIERPVRVFNVALGVPPAGISSAVTPTVPPPASAAPDRPSIAVLPFNNMSGDPEQEYFSDGITEDIITDLSKISGLHVIARNTAFTYRGKSVTMTQVAQDLGVRFVLEGSVRKAGERVRITGQLIDGKDGSLVWADRYDRDLTDIFAIQDDITHTIVSQLKVRILPEEKAAIERAPTENIEAYTYYLRGRQYLHLRTRAFLTLGRRMFARAVELDPHYARAYAGMATCDSLLASWHQMEISVDDILAITGRALAIDPDLAEAHAARGLALSFANRRDEAAAAFERALSLDPDGYEANYYFARFSFANGELEAAARHFIRAIEIEPDDYRSPLHLQNVLPSLGRPEEGERYARLGLERAEKALMEHPEGSGPAQLGAAALARLGERDRAKEWLARAMAIDPDDIHAQYNAACVYALLGETDRAIDILESYLAHASGERKRWFIHDSDLDPIRDHPRYQKLLEIIR